MRSERTVAIIGGGVAGLAAGVLLARQGARVLLFEARDEIGGCCANTRVDGFTFHDGALYVAAPGLLDAAFARLGLDRARLVPLRRADAGYTATLEDGSVVSVSPRRMRVRRPGAEREVSLDGEVEHFIDRWRPLVRLFGEDLLLHPFSAWRLISRGFRQLPKLRGTLADELRLAFADEAARSALAGFMLYTGTTAEKLPAALAFGLVAVLDEGFFLPKGGMGRIPEALGEAFVASGGEIHTRSPVERIVVRRGRAAGVEVSGRGMVEADVVLSSVSGMTTLARLVAPDVVPARLRRKVDSAPISHTAVSVQLGLSNRIDVPSHGNALLPMLESHHRVFVASEVDRWINWSVPTVTVPELAPPGGSIVEMFCPRQPGAPAEADERIADRAVAALGRLHRLDVAVRRVRGPEHFRDHMHLFEGALYGLSPAADPRSQFPHQTRIPGLFLAGQTTYPGSGVNPAMLSGVLAAEAALADRLLQSRVGSGGP